MPELKCKDCANGDWLRTPTGRIKALRAGQCMKLRELLAHYEHTQIAPCVKVSKPIKQAIWPDADATGCPMYSAIPPKTK